MFEVWLVKSMARGKGKLSSVVIVEQHVSCREEIEEAGKGRLKKYFGEKQLQVRLDGRLS